MPPQPSNVLREEHPIKHRSPMLSKVSGNPSMVAREEHNANAFSPIVFTTVLDKATMLDRLEQEEKASLPTRERFPDNPSRDVRRLQLLKHLFGMLVMKPPHPTIEVRLVQFSKAESPIAAIVVLVSAEMSVRLEQFLKAFEDIVERPRGIPERSFRVVHPSKQFGPNVHIFVPDMSRRFVHVEYPLKQDSPR